MFGIVVFIDFAALVALVSIPTIRLVRRLKRSELVTVQKWAERNSMELLHARERALFEPAPFFFWTSHRTPNYFVRVRDQHGKERCGWIRLGTFWGCILGDS